MDEQAVVHGDYIRTSVAPAQRERFVLVGVLARQFTEAQIVTLFVTSVHQLQSGESRQIITGLHDLGIQFIRVAHEVCLDVLTKDIALGLRIEQVMTFSIFHGHITHHRGIIPNGQCLFLVIARHKEQSAEHETARS